MQSYLPALAILGKAGRFFWTLSREYQPLHSQVGVSELHPIVFADLQDLNLR
jgi:hypothetical protein